MSQPNSVQDNKLNYTLSLIDMRESSNFAIR